MNKNIIIKLYIVEIVKNLKNFIIIKIAIIIVFKDNYMIQIILAFFAMRDMMKKNFIKMENVYLNVIMDMKQLF